MYALPFYASFLSLGSALFAVRVGQHPLVPLAVFLTSINYWRRPTPGIRRTLDMIVVCLGGVYQLSYPSAAYRISVLVCLVCYFVARRRRSARWHCALHIVANAGNCLLYAQITGYGSYK